MIICSFLGGHNTPVSPGHISPEITGHIVPVWGGHIDRFFQNSAKPCQARENL